MSFSGKVAIIGAGYVGSSIAYTLVVSRIAREIVLIEQASQIDKCRAEVLDIRHGIPFMGSGSVYCGDYSDIKGCELIIITAGRNRRPNETRLELAKDNIEITDTVIAEMQKSYDGGVVLVVANPVDILTRRVTEQMNLRKGLVFGTGCILDCSRLTNILAEYASLSAESINSSIIGEHGESQIVLWSKTFVGGIAANVYFKTTNVVFNDKVKNEMEQRIVKMGTEIISGKGRTHYGIAICVAYLANSILNRHSTVSNVSSVLYGEYGINNVALSLPSVITANGVEQRLVDDLAKNEINRLLQTADKLEKIHLSIKT